MFAGVSNVTIGAKREINFAVNCLDLGANVNEMKNDKSIFVKCQCYSEGMSIDYDAQDDQYYFAYWKQGMTNQALGWKEKIRHCWNIIKTGKPFNDEVIINQEDANKLSDFLKG